MSVPSQVPPKALSMLGEVDIPSPSPAALSSQVSLCLLILVHMNDYINVNMCCNYTPTTTIPMLKWVAIMLWCKMVYGTKELLQLRSKGTLAKGFYHLWKSQLHVGLRTWDGMDQPSAYNQTQPWFSQATWVLALLTTWTVRTMSK